MTTCISTSIVLKFLISTIGNISKFGGACECFQWLLVIFFMTFCFNISSFDFFNNQFQCSTSTNIHLNICIVPQFTTNNGIFFDYHTCLVVLGPTLSSYNSLVVLKLCSLNLVATRFACLELHKIVFTVSRILLIVGFQGLLNPLSTNR